MSSVKVSTLAPSSNGICINGGLRLDVEEKSIYVCLAPSTTMGGANGSYERKTEVITADNSGDRKTDVNVKLSDEDIKKFYTMKLPILLDRLGKYVDDHPEDKQVKEALEWVVMKKNDFPFARAGAYMGIPSIPEVSDALQKWWKSVTNSQFFSKYFSFPTSVTIPSVTNPYSTAYTTPSQRDLPFRLRPAY